MPFDESIAFLYTGSAPVQTGVANDTIDPMRASVIRGRVLTRQNNPLAGVTITIKDHPEFGQTQTRADGWFDMAVNGGGLLTVDYQREDFLPVQREVDAPWRGYAIADDIVMIQLDPQVTTINLSSAEPYQVAQGSEQTDTDGTRHATILFPQGTTATMTLPDGSLQTLSTINVRATEYTVGENGQQAMPATLPPYSAYTYAIELSVDEAINADARRVDFNQNVSFYVDNYLAFPVDTEVPVGYYDFELSAWVPENNGRIIEVLSIENGLAVLDLNGDGNAASQAELDALNITLEEQQQLAEMYSAGQSAWRVLIGHFTPIDCNFASRGTSRPKKSKSKKLSDKDGDDDTGECDGCIIKPQGQILGETIPLVGTPYKLNYRSNRVAGYNANNTVIVPVTPPFVSPNLRGVIINVQVAGQEFSQHFTAQPNQTFHYAWDGLDVYGRVARGTHLATITHTYEFSADYSREIRSGLRGFINIGAINNPDLLATRPQITFTTKTISRLMLGNIPALPNALGGWTLDVNHFFDINAKELLMGNGKRIKRSNIQPIQTVAGDLRANGSSGDGGLALEALLNSPTSLQASADGSIYFSDNDNRVIRRINADGTMARVAGTGNECQVGAPCGDGGSALNADLTITDLSLDKNNNIYVLSNGRIRRIGEDGIIRAFAGIDAAQVSGDEGPALLASLGAPVAIAAANDGSVFVATQRSIRQITMDGWVHHLAGDESVLCGLNFDCGDLGPIAEAAFNAIRDLDVSTNGDIYVLESSRSRAGNRIRHITPNGRIESITDNTFSCSSAWGLCGDGGLISEAQFNDPTRIEAINDEIYISSANRVRVIGSDGFVTTLAGTGRGCTGVQDCGEGGPASAARFSGNISVGVGPDNSVYISDDRLHVIRKVGSVYPAFNNDDYLIASKSGRELFQFDRAGIHLRTFDTLTGATTYEFEYDSNGLLIGVRDVDGDLTTIVRNINGNPTAIISADQQRTNLTINSDGYLQIVENLADESYEMEYTNSGLMLSFTDPRQQENAFEYDTEGHLTRDINAGGGGWTLEREEDINSVEVTMTSTEGRVYDFLGSKQSDGSINYESVPPNRLSNNKTLNTSGTEINEKPNFIFIRKNKTADPRFGSEALYESNLTVRTPSGLLLNKITDRVAELQNPVDKLSLLTLTETNTINDRVYVTEFNANANIATTITPEGRIATQEINDKGKLVNAQIEGLHPVSFDYDNRGRLSKITQGDAVVSTDLQRLTQLTYYQTGNQQGYLESLTDAVGRTVNFEYDLAGRITRQILPDSCAIEYGYDSNGNLASITPPGRPAHIFNYNAFDLESQYTPPSIPGIDNVSTVYAHNLDKQLTRITRPDNLQINFNYNDNGQLTDTVLPDRAYDYEYHPDTGQLTGIIISNGGSLNIEYDGFLPVAQSWGGEINGAVRNSYNNDFQVSSISVNGSNIVAYEYDDDMMLTTAGSFELLRDEQRAGLVNGTLIGVIQSEYAYNEFSEITNQITSRSSDVDLLDSLSNQIRAILSQLESHPDSDILAIDYTTINALAADLPTGFALYRPELDELYFQYLVESSNPEFQEWGNQLVQLSDTLGVALDGSYDAILNTVQQIATLVDQMKANQAVIDAGFDFENLDSAVSALPSDFEDYNDALGDLDNFLEDFVSDDYVYGIFDELYVATGDLEALIKNIDVDSLPFGNLSENIYAVNYVRDNLGRITEKTETIVGATTSEVYDYDLAGRLETVTRNGDITTYAYDANGNRLSRSEGAVVESGRYDDQDRLTNYNGCNYDYTANGELTQKTCASDITNYTYDVLGNLLNVTLPNGDVIEYIVDGQNRRIGRKANGATTQGRLYKDQLNPVAELDAAGNVVPRFVYADKTNVPAYIIRDGISYRITSDHLGSPRLVINSNSGEIIQRIDYDEFGRVILDTNPGFQPFGFAGGLYDPQSELVRFGARDYDAQSGRWTAKDPIKFDGGINLYGYSFGDPINYVDVTGEAPNGTGIVGGFMSAIGTALVVGGMAASLPASVVIAGVVIGVTGAGLVGWETLTTSVDQINDFKESESLETVNDTMKDLQDLIDKERNSCP